MINVPRDVDNWLYVQFVLFFLIGFIINVYSNGQATLIFFEDKYDISVDESIPELYGVKTNEEYIQQYANKTSFRNKKALYGMLFLYWFVSPLVNFYFAFFVFKKGKLWEASISDGNDFNIFVNRR